MEESGGRGEEKGAKVGIKDSPNFRGRSSTRLDSKGRLRLPAKFREVLQKHYPDESSLVLSQYGECLVAYPPEKWDNLEAKALDGLSQVHPDHRSFIRSFVSIAERCEFDSQGRMLIPPLLREDAHLDQEVMLVGMLEHFEIWGKNAYELQAGRDRENQPRIMESIASSGL